MDLLPWAADAISPTYVDLLEARLCSGPAMAAAPDVGSLWVAGLLASRDSTQLCLTVHQAADPACLGSWKLPRQGLHAPLCLQAFSRTVAVS